MATPALAINRYNSMSYSCSAAQALIGRERAVIFRHPAERTKNLTLYDRYVSDRGACNFGEYAFEDTLPTKDTKNCQSTPVTRQANWTTTRSYPTVDFGTPPILSSETASERS